MVSSSAQQRVLACVACQQRKVKCDRKFPCSNCIKSNVTCVPASRATRQRRRRFPERELLARIRQYEDLLKKNDIDFEALHPTASASIVSDGTEHSSLQPESKSKYV